MAVLFSENFSILTKTLILRQPPRCNCFYNDIQQPAYYIGMRYLVNQALGSSSHIGYVHLQAI
jgi:hypothetical protein